MISEKLKKRASELVEKADKKRLIKKYDEYCKTKEARDYALSKDEIVYYTSKYGGNK